MGGSLCVCVCVCVCVSAGGKIAVKVLWDVVRNTQLVNLALHNLLRHIQTVFAIILLRI